MNYIQSFVKTFLAQKNCWEEIKRHLLKGVLKSSYLKLLPKMKWKIRFENFYSK